MQIYDFSPKYKWKINVFQRKSMKLYEINGTPWNVMEFHESHPLGMGGLEWVVCVHRSTLLVSNLWGEA